MKKHFLFHSRRKCCEKSKESVLVVTSEKAAIHSIIGREIITGNIEYTGKSGQKGFDEYVKDCMAGVDVLIKLKHSERR